MYSLLKNIYRVIRAFFYNVYFRMKRKEKTFFLLGTEDFLNLGDWHIAFSIKEFLKKHYPDYAILEVPASVYFLLDMKKWIRKEDVICLTGGGNFGNQYILAQNIRRDVVTKYKSNKIVGFPVSVYYTDDEEGKKELEKDIEIFNRHEDLVLTARERVSYEMLEKYFEKTKNYLLPDIVLYSSYSHKEKSGKAMLCLRSDLEGILGEKDKEFIEKTALNYYDSIQNFDTQYHDPRARYRRKHELMKAINYFRESDLVITDRLHGMIFATITKTPCIALSNYNHKVEGVSQWLKNTDYVRFIRSIDELEKNIKDLRESKTEDRLQPDFEKEFGILLQELGNER